MSGPGRNGGERLNLTSRLSATSAASLSRDLQPVTADPVKLSLWGELRGLPADEGALATLAPAREQAFPKGPLKFLISSRLQM
ncbi:hypothetical protein [Methylacidimicrobium sp. B4]|uniref:hypothetical protein n=1 Tax=Methylacidimicrobium sp. B4 TaxID=2796139 RepID=UPI001A9035B0|nr:hypothetical protein [Methylacidimicrobium sp. B4]QSR85892.1 hypothetical protein MacB4_09075 [Methylacidimicrobium sp. B4]